MNDLQNPIALREWAVAVEALEQGRQIIVMRKGGIAEETKDFRLESHSFYLFPSYEHQKPHVIKPEAHEALVRSQREAAEHPNTVRITSYAEVVEDIEVTDAQTLHKLKEMHIWTEDYADERLHWKKTKPLHVLLLRVYRLDEPFELPLSEAYEGCKSWLTLETFHPVSKRTPVLVDSDFEARVLAVRSAIKPVESDI